MSGTKVLPTIVVYLNFTTMKIISVAEFYENKNMPLPDSISREIGHFNVFDVAEITEMHKRTSTMPYNRRAFYKINLIIGRNRAEYADKVINIEKSALIFSTPKIPYNWIPQDPAQAGNFCIFTEEFMLPSKTGLVLEDLPIFKSGGYPVFEVREEEKEEIQPIFKKMIKEMSSNYVYKYDLIRNYIIELIHFGQKLQPTTALYPAHNAGSRVSALFVELLERQFPIESTRQQLALRTAKDYADRLAIHVNHLNKVLKEQTGKTTTDLISSRITQEAKILLKQTNWTISEIGYCLGFEEVAHFSNFFRKQTTLSPIAFRD